MAVLVVPPRSAIFKSSFRAVSERRNVLAIFLSFMPQSALSQKTQNLRRLGKAS